MSESEWQPAISINIHHFSVTKNPSPDRVMIRVATEMEVTEALANKRTGCDAKTFYVVQRDGSILCEHEILTD